MGGGANNLFRWQLLLVIFVAMFVLSACDGDDIGIVDGDTDVILPDGDQDADVEEVIDGDSESVTDGDEETCEGCLIDGQCIASGAEDSEQPCAICDPENDKEGWSPKDVTVECRASVGECDVSEMCDGENLVCPEDAFVAADTNCGDAATECSGQDTCDGSGVCQANHLLETVSCGDAGTECVNQDYCDGAGACADKGNKSDGTMCSMDKTGAYDQCVAGVCVDCFDLSGCNDWSAGGRDSECYTKACKNNICGYDAEPIGTSCEMNTGKVSVESDQCNTDGFCVDCTDINGCNDFPSDNNPCTDAACVANVCDNVNNNSNSCSDEVGCTDTACSDGVCVVDNINAGCFIDETCLENNTTKGLTGNDQCQACVAGTNQEAWTPLNSGVCNDDNSCTYDDACSLGTCAGVAYSCNEHGSCDGDGTCTCEIGYDGDTCDVCAEGYQDNDNDGSCYVSCTSDAAPVCMANGFGCNDSSGSASCACGGSATEYFSDDFEDNNYDGWILDSNNVEIVASEINGSNYALQITNYEQGHGEGISRDINSDQPASMSYYFKYSGANLGVGYMTFSHYDDMIGMDMELGGLQLADDGKLSQLGGHNPISATALSTDTWYFIEISFDWDDNKYDVYIDGELGKAGILMSDATATDITAIEYHNFSANTTLTIDEVQLYNCPPPVARPGKVAAGWGYSCAISGDNVKCWGDNWHGVLGTGDEVDSLAPTMVYDIADAAYVATQGWTACVIRSSGQTSCWGYNNAGRVGDGSGVLTLFEPADSVGMDNTTSLGAGPWHMCGTHADGTVKCWGDGSSGKMGDGSTDPNMVPTDVTGITNAVDVDAGDSHSCALLEDYTVRCWGSNSMGQLGDGTNSSALTPVNVDGLSGAIAIGVGGNTTCAIVSNDSIKCWGLGNAGQLGNEVNQNSSVPVDVVGINNAISIVVGSSHACALLEDSTVKCWGSNYYGQLGNGENTNSSVPVSVSGLSNVTSIASIYNHTCAYLEDGTVKCWGSNSEGQLGDGTQTTSNVPVTVQGL